MHPSGENKTPNDQTQYLFVYVVVQRIKVSRSVEKKCTFGENNIQNKIVLMTNSNTLLLSPQLN